MKEQQSCTEQTPQGVTGESLVGETGRARSSSRSFHLHGLLLPPMRRRRALKAMAGFQHNI
jgi:hypothetical protein